MSERKYSVSEIDQMRNSVDWMTTPYGAYYPEKRKAEIEDRLRTYMLNGTEPRELHEAAMEISRLRYEAYLASQQRREDWAKRNAEREEAARKREEAAREAPDIVAHRTNYYT